VKNLVSKLAFHKWVSTRTAYAAVARQLSRSLKLFAFIDILLCLLYVFAG
jgi:hypothetical protein